MRSTRRRQSRSRTQRSWRSIAWRCVGTLPVFCSLPLPAAALAAALGAALGASSDGPCMCHCDKAELIVKLMVCSLLQVMRLAGTPLLPPCCRLACPAHCTLQLSPPRRSARSLRTMRGAWGGGTPPSGSSMRRGRSSRRTFGARGPCGSEPWRLTTGEAWLLL